VFATIGFVGALVMTLVFLGIAVVTGYKAKRKIHLSAVGGAVAMLVLTIYFAIELGKLYDLHYESTITRVHLGVARYNTAAYLLPVITGLRTLKNPAGRKLHGRVAWGVLLLTVFTAVTGCIMLLRADLLPT
jgi:hypothetical protein